MRRSRVIVVLARAACRVRVPRAQVGEPRTQVVRQWEPVVHQRLLRRRRRGVRVRADVLPHGQAGALVRVEDAALPAVVRGPGASGVRRQQAYRVLPVQQLRDQGVVT